jgi:hypothetical protein
MSQIGGEGIEKRDHLPGILERAEQPDKMAEGRWQNSSTAAQQHSNSRSAEM